MKRLRPEDAAPAEEAAGERRPTRPRLQSRRRFLSLAAAGSAAVLIGGAAAPKRGKAQRARPAPAQTAASPAEIQKLKQYTVRALRTIRDYPLPAGSEMAFVFQPMKARPAPRKRVAAEPER